MLVAFAVQTATEDVKGSMAAISANARPTGTNNIAKAKNINNALGPVNENQ